MGELHTHAGIARKRHRVPALEMAAIALVLTVLVAAQPAFAATVYYVDASASGANDGSSWQNAYTDLQAALDQASGTGAEVWVAGGTYKPVGSRFAMFYGADLQLYGGFAGTETSPDQRDLRANETILSGDIGVEGDYSDNLYHVLYVYGNSTRVDGFTVRDGNADGTLTDDTAGGGLSFGDGANLSHMTVTGNRAIYGAGVYAYQASGVLRDSTITGNTATYGGGMYLYQGSPGVENVTITGNAASDVGGGVVQQAGGMLANVTISNNSAGSHGGGIFNSAGGSMVLRESILWGNTGDQLYRGGGGVSYTGTNLIEGGCPGNTTCNSANVVTGDPALGSLADNGGPTRTQALGSSSAAIDAGGACPATDQRGLGRPQDGPDGDSTPSCDLGAFEYLVPTVTLSATPASGAESDATFAVQLDHATVQPVTVDFSATAVTAAGGGVDFALPAGSVTIPAGSATATFAAIVEDDDLDEETEVFNAAITGVTGATTGLPSSADYSILDDDSAPTLTLTLDADDGDESQTAGPFIVELSATSGRVVSAGYVVSRSGSGLDFDLSPGTITIQPGQTQATISVPVVDDGTDEDDESLTVSLTEPVNASMGVESFAIYLVHDNDDPPSVAFALKSSAASERTAIAAVAVELTAASERQVLVPYSTSDDSAQAPADYVASDGVLVFEPGETEASLDVGVVDDFAVEGEEVVFVNLNTPTNATVGVRPKHAILIASDDAGVCGGVAATLAGTSAADTIRGTDGDDVIAAGGGDDRVFGLGGNDVICGDDGADRLSGDDGNDRILGGTGDDALRGGPGDDTLRGLGGADRLLGNAGADALRGEGGADVAIGGAGDDLVSGGGGTDRVIGRGGSDTLWGGPGAGDRCDGSAGEDTLGPSHRCEAVIGVP